MSLECFLNCFPMTIIGKLSSGSLQSLDWTGGLDWWTGPVDWTGGLTSFALKFTFMPSKQTHLPAQLHDVLQ